MAHGLTLIELGREQAHRADVKLSVSHCSRICPSSGPTVCISTWFLTPCFVVQSWASKSCRVGQQVAGQSCGKACGKLGIEGRGEGGRATGLLGKGGGRPGVCDRLETVLSLFLAVLPNSPGCDAKCTCLIQPPRFVDPIVGVNPAHAVVSGSSFFQCGRPPGSGESGGDLNSSADDPGKNVAVRHGPPGRRSEAAGSGQACPCRDPF